MSEPSIWLDRRLPESFLTELMPGGRLRWLVEFATTSEHARLTDLVLVGDQKHGRSPRVHVYAGTAGLITVEWLAHGRVRLKAAKGTKTFAGLTFADQWASPLDLDQVANYAPALLVYLSAKVALAADHFAKEGRVQVAVMRGGPGWTALDREVVPQYPSAPVRQEVQAALRTPIDGARRRLAKHHSWATNWKRTGFELDCLAVDAHGDILVVEVKAGDDDAYAEKAPLQVAQYQLMIERCLRESPITLEGLKGVAKQRAQLGLCQALPSFSPKPAVRPVVAISAPFGKRAADRWSAVLHALRDSGMHLSGLEIWRVDSNGEVTATGTDDLHHAM